MIKKIIACLTICFIITGIISPVFSDASALPQPNWSDPGISEIINISDLTGWMLNGGTFDVSQYTDAESFMNDYFNARTKTRLVSPGEAAEDYYEVLPGFGINNQFVAGESFANPLDTNRVIASSFRDHTGYGRRLSNEVNDALLSTGSLYDTKIPLLNEIEFSNFVGYNHNALQIYSNLFIYDNPTPTPNPDPEYSYLQSINNLYYPDGRSYSARNLFVTNMILKNTDGSIIVAYDPHDYSYIGEFINNNGNNFHLGQNIGNLQDLSVSLSSSIITINIDSSDPNNVLVQYSNINYTDFNTNLKVFSFFGWQQPDNQVYTYMNPYQNYKSFVQSSFENLSDAVNYVFKHYCNINLYVNGALWVLSGDPVIPPSITPEFPDAVGGDELPNTTWPIFRPRAPYYTNVPGVLQAIEDAIADDGELDIDDLKPYLTDENGDPLPDPIFDPEPVPLPVPDPVNPDVVPGLPVLPALPPEMPGFSGVSVLAEIINFTNQSLPTALIVTFWGVVFGIVILGLIKILHK